MSSDVRSALRDAGRDVADKQLTWGASGNISARTDHNSFVISASGARLGHLDHDVLVECDFEGVVVVGTARASVERMLHALVYRERQNVGAVLHASPFHATLVACSVLPVDTAVSTDTAFYLPRVERVDFYPPSSLELAEAVTRAARVCDAILLRNHGAVTFGRSPEEAVLRMECLEMLCHMLVVQKSGFPLVPLDESRIASLSQYLTSDIHP